MMAVGALFGILYFLLVATVAVLCVWALVLLIIFLRLRIAELRAAAAASGTQGTGRLG